MEQTSFDKLEDKVNMALEVIKGLKESQDSLTQELHTARDTNKQLEEKIREQEEEMSQVRADVSSKSANAEEANRRIDDLISRLEDQKLEELLVS